MVHFYLPFFSIDIKEIDSTSSRLGTAWIAKRWSQGWFGFYLLKVLAVRETYGKNTGVEFGMESRACIESEVRKTGLKAKRRKEI